MRKLTCTKWSLTVPESLSTGRRKKTVSPDIFRQECSWVPSSVRALQDSMWPDMLSSHCPWVGTSTQRGTSTRHRARGDMSTHSCAGAAGQSGRMGLPSLRVALLSVLGTGLGRAVASVARAEQSRAEAKLEIQHAAKTQVHLESKM